MERASTTQGQRPNTKSACGPSSPLIATPTPTPSDGNEQGTSYSDKKFCNADYSGATYNNFGSSGPFRQRSVPASLKRNRQWELDGVGNTKKREVGAALIETAIVLPLLLALTFGIWTLARAWNVRNTMEHAAREAVRFGATELPWDGTSVSQVRAVIDSELNTSAVPPASVATLCIDKNATPCGFSATAQGYDQVAVRVQYTNYQLNFLFFSTNINITVEAVGRYEG